jgi:predicted cation transporter
VQFDPLDIGLFVIVLIVLLGPFLVKKIEHNLEAFLFVMGVLAVTISSFYSKPDLMATLGYTEHQVELIGWNMEIVMEALEEPIIK